MIRHVLLSALILAGCQPAGRYHSKAPPDTRPKPETLEVPPIPKLDDQDVETDAGLVWQQPDPKRLRPDAPIVFVHASQPAWHTLKDFWNPEWHRPVMAIGLSPLGALAAADWLTPSVRIRVPLGLDDPTPLIPAANPPTLAKWQLGKDLFFDERVVLPSGHRTKQSCASCHNPATAFTDPKLTTRETRLDTPTLNNVAYQPRQFWDGRVGELERVVQLSLEDEKAAIVRHFHSWPGVVQRLRDDPTYYYRFQTVFGCEPTQDAVGKAIATYLRTILSANAVQDRAEQARHARGGKTLEAGDYEKAIDDAALTALPWRHGPKLNRSELATELHKGHTLFHGKAGCARCHGGSTYRDGQFHNLGIAESGMLRLPGREPGRFATAPPGEKGLYLIGAFKTPTLRDLPRTAPYFHNGSRILIDRDVDEVLFEVIVWHVATAPPRRDEIPYLAPALRRRDLKEEEIRSLVMFLKALDGEPAPAILNRGP